MTNPKEEIQEKYGVNMRSTKQAIYDALLAASQCISESSVELPQEEANRKHSEEVVKSAKADVELNVFSKEYTERFKALQEAIEVEQKKLQDLYNVDNSLASMAVLIESQKKIRQQFNEEAAKIREDLDQYKEKCEKQKDALDQEENEYRDQLAKTRIREEEQYRYDIGIKHRDETDKLTAELNEIKKKISEQQAKLDEINADISHYEALEENTENFPARLEAEYNRGVEEGKKAANNSNKFESAMAKKDAEHEKTMFEKEIAMLREDNRNKQGHIDRLEEKLNNAYTQINELAKRTAETSGSIKVIGGESSKK